MSAIKRSIFWRFLEILPGALAWMGIILPILFSAIWPSAVAIYVLLFDLFWVSNALLMAVFMFATFKKMKIALHTDFGSKLEAIPKDDPKNLNHEEIYQVVMFATFREELDTLEPSVESVVESNWSRKRMIIMLAGEERDRERLYRVGNYLKDKYGHKICDFLISEHPDGIAGEVRGKGAGCHFAGERLSEYCAAHNLDEGKVLVTVADADTRFQKQYFNAITLAFVSDPNRYRRTFQPIPLFSNNIWHAHFVARLTAWGSSFWQMIESSRQWRLVNFSTHSYSLKMLHEMDYWFVNVVNEDSGQFWRAYFAFDGDHRVVPVYLPVHMDAVFADDIGTTLKNQYLQKRRWAYGIEHFPYIVTMALKDKKIPWGDKWGRIFRLVWETYNWSTASFYLALVGWLPLIFSDAYRHTVLAVNMPTITKLLLPLAWIVTAISAYISLSFLPPKPESFKKTKYLEMLVQWFILPVTAVIWGSIPAFDSQTRLMLGKYMTFWVTPKSKVSEEKIAKLS